MKRYLWFALFLAGTLAVLTAPASVKAAEGTDDSASALQEDVNTAIGSLTTRIAGVEKKQGMEIEIHGFEETDLTWDSVVTGKNEYLSNVAIPKNNTELGSTSQLQESVRNSRIDFLAKTTVDGWLTKGYLEGDFLGASNGSADASNLWVAPTFRIRHCYLDLQKDGWDFMSGQYWTLFGWNMDYVLASVQPQPIMGTVYERTPRIGIMKTMGDDAQIQIALDAERPEQSESGYPNVDAGIRFNLTDWKGDFTYATGATKKVPLSVGISGTVRNYSFGNIPVDNLAGNAATVAYGDNVIIYGTGLAIDAMIPILPSNDKDDPSLTASCEWTYGSGIADELNGFTGGLTSLTANGGITFGDAGIAGAYSAGSYGLVDTLSYNAQVQFHFPKSFGTLVTGGYGEVFSDNVASFGGTYNDDNNIFVNVMQDCTDNIRFAVEMDLAQTHYISAAAGQVANDTRVALASWYRF